MKQSINIRNSLSEQHRCRLIIKGKSKTKQAHKDECDVNKIIAKYRKTGVLTHLKNNPQNFEFAPNLDFQESLEYVEKAREQFMELPATIRNKFQNNPADFVAFVENPENKSEMIEMGLLPREPEFIDIDPPDTEPQPEPTEPDSE